MGNINSKDKKNKPALQKQHSRRSMLKSLAVGAAAAMIPTTKTEASTFFEKFFQKHYQELTPADKEKVFERIQKETLQDYGVQVNVGDPQPLPKVRYAYCLNLSKCNGSRYCVAACQKENNLDRSIQYIKVLEMDKGSFNLEKSNRFYSGKVPKEGKFYLPVQCHHCENAPCTRACPIEATWKEKDGIVVVDYDWCIGCRYCQAACPYEARSFNYHTPKVPKEEINPNQAYLSNRIRPRGVIEKCTFCLQRVRNGRFPACLEACPTGSRKFGNILDPESEVSQILRKKHVYILKEELNTIPSFFYFFD